MRILHTSDWHLGRTFHGVDLLDDQRQALAHVADVVRDNDIDVVIVAGDVYDRSVPSADAVVVYDQALQALRAAGATIVVTSGNHDSPTRLGVGSSFAAAGGLHLRTTIADIDTPVVLADEYGPVAIYGIPYLEPEVARMDLGVPQARSHADVLGAAMDRVRGHLAVHPARSVVVAHAFVVGATASGSERCISVGGVETVGAEVFSGVDYVALGHLHSPQAVTDTVRYSGSPLPYSFGEATHEKSVWLVEIDAQGAVEVSGVPIPQVRGLRSLTGTLDELLSAEQYTDAEGDYIDATLTDAVRPIDPMRRLRTRFPHAVTVAWRNPRADDLDDQRHRLRGRSDLDVVSAFVTDVRDAPSAREIELIEGGLRAVVGEPEHVASVPDTGNEATEIVCEDGAFALFALPDDDQRESA
ncbi:exonuclease SbcCD subunit D [Williamsia sp. CHRR-6]|uniref:exonuclease SbcCD subunit D n=1 Tax=Williamsia sp. CHRR-6 TaxID=2835871 RepID=UPI001BD94EE7|nr:exonuclease SbcCD subunit D [Williamsia sp. CHRR-6]MBT0568443.1 exonuclease SbcCD subunit D [Williamsia sp. CHRR-6]